MEPEEWDGREREIVDHPGATAIVAIGGERCVTLVRQRREAVRRRLVDLLAGTLEPGEEPLASAERELRDEVGLHGGRWRELGAFYATPGFCRGRMHVFVAEDVEEGRASPEEDEDVEIVRLIAGPSCSISSRGGKPGQQQACPFAQPPPRVGSTPASLFAIDDTDDRRARLFRFCVETCHAPER
jgi:ADP-ribose pyrophosphatase